MRIIDDLAAYERRQAWLVETRDAVSLIMMDKLECLQLNGKKPELNLGEFMAEQKEFLGLNDSETEQMRSEIFTMLSDELVTDGMTVKFKDAIITCECGAKYSSRIGNCPNCRR